MKCIFMSTSFQKQKRPTLIESDGLAFSFQTAGKFLSVMTTVHPEKVGWLLPIGVLKVYNIC